MVRILVPTSVGDFLDRISILEIKKRKDLYVDKELGILIRLALESNLSLDDDNYKELKAVNSQLWDAEDAIRNSPDDEAFLNAARAVITLNELRSELKQKINDKYGSEFQEAKDYRRRDHDVSGS